MPAGTRFSRLYNRVTGRETGQTIGQFFGGGLAASLRFGLPSAALYGTARGIANSVREAAELERQFVAIEGQFNETFGSAGQAKFKEFRSEILKIARDTGVAASTVANIGFQIQGAFGEGATDSKGQPLTIAGKTGGALVKEQLQAAGEISSVTGLGEKEVVDSLTAASLNFNKSFREIGDTTLFLQDRFGVLAKEIIPFLGDIAPVAKEAGFSLNEFAAIAAITQQTSGRSGQALAEAFGRVLPAIEQNRVELVRLAASVPQLNNKKTIETFATGSIKDIFTELARVLPGLDEQTQGVLFNLLGGRREASSIIGVLTSGKLDTTIRSLAAAPGTLATRFAATQASLSQSLLRMKESFRQAGVAIFEGGLGDILKEMAKVAKILAEALTILGNALGGVDDAFGGFGIEILAAVTALNLLIKAYRQYMVLRAIDTFTGGAKGSPLQGPLIGGGTLGTAARTGILARTGAALAGPAFGAGAALGPIATVAAAAGAFALGYGGTMKLVKGTNQRANEKFQTKLADMSDKELASYLGARDFKPDRGVGQIAPGNIDIYNRKAVDNLDGTISTVRSISIEIDGKNILIPTISSTGEVLTPEAAKKLYLSPLSEGGGRNLGTFDTPNAADQYAVALSEAEAVIQERKKERGGHSILGSLGYGKKGVAIGTIPLAGPPVALSLRYGGDQFSHFIEPVTNLLNRGAGKATQEDLINRTLLFNQNYANVKDDQERFTNVFTSEGGKNALQETFGGPGGGTKANDILADAEKYKKTFSKDAQKSFHLPSEKDFKAALVDPNLEFVKQLIKDAASDPGAEKLLVSLGESSPEMKKLLDAEKERQDKAKDPNLILAAAKGQDTEAAFAAYSAGELPIGALKKAVDAEVAALDIAINSAKAKGKDSSDEEKIKFDKLKALRTEYSKALDDQFDFKELQIDTAGGSGTETGDLQRQLSAVVAKTQDETYASDPDAMKKAGQSILSIKRAILLQMMSEAKTAAEAIAIGTIGIVFNPDEQEAFVKTQLNASNEAWTGVLAAYKTVHSGYADILIEGLVAHGLATEGGIDAMIAAINEELAALGGDDFTADYARGLSELVVKLSALKGKIYVPKVTKANASDLAQYKKTAAEEANAYADALADYQLALIEGDPVKVAQHGVDEANRMLREASNATETLKAQAAKIRADRSLELALHDVATSKTDILRAQLEAAHDTVGVAKLNQDEANKELARVIGLRDTGGAGDADVNNATKNKISADAAERDAEIAKARDDASFLFDMGKITKGQYINLLKNVLKTAGIPEDVARDIQRQIKQLSGEIGGDLQFNIPTNLKLPTLYESRRVSQSGGTGGYQDNRNVTITLYVTDGTTAAQMQQVFQDVLGGPNKYSTVMKKY